MHVILNGFLSFKDFRINLRILSERIELIQQEMSGRQPRNFGAIMGNSLKNSKMHV